MDRQYRRAGEPVGEAVAGIQQGCHRGLPPPPLYGAAVQLSPDRVAGLPPEHHRQHCKASTSGKEKHFPVQAPQNGHSLPGLQKLYRRQQDASHGAGEQEEHEKLPRERPAPSVGQPHQRSGYRQFRQHRRAHAKHRQGAQRPICTSQRGGQQEFPPVHRQCGHPGRHIQRQSVGKKVEEKRDIQVDHHPASPFPVC